MITPHSKFNITVCSTGKNPNLKSIIDNFYDIQKYTEEELILTVVINGDSLENFSFPSYVRVFLEENLGYASVRNRALLANPLGYNLIFIDDDEIITREWLCSLIIAHKIHPKSLLAGPVKPVHVHEFSYRATTDLRLSKIPNGAQLSKAPSCNLLIPSHALLSPSCYFDEFFQLGGEDTDLTYRLTRTGFDLRWVKDAVLLEIEDPSRLTESYLNSRIRKDSCNHALAYRRNHSAHLNMLFSLRLLRNITVLYFLKLVTSRSRLTLEANVSALSAFLRGKF